MRSRSNSTPSEINNINICEEIKTIEGNCDRGKRIAKKDGNELNI